MITANATTLVNQAPMTVESYLFKGKEFMDEYFPTLTPELQVQFLIAFIQACTTDFQTAIIMKEFREIVEYYISGKFVEE